MQRTRIGRLAARFVTKQAVQNGVWLYLLQLVQTVVPLVCLPYVTRVLGADRYGSFSLAVNLIGYLQVVVEYGFAMSATRQVAQSDQSPATLSRIVTGVLCSRAILLGICLAAAGAYLAVFHRQREQCLCLALLLLSLVGSCLQLNWLFQGIRRLRPLVLVTLAARSVSVALTFLLVRTGEDLYLYCLLYAAVPLVSGLLGLAAAGRCCGIRPVRPAPGQLMQVLRQGWYVFTTQFSGKLFGGIGLTLLGLFSAGETVGIYAAVQKIPNLFLLGWAPFSQLLYPMSSERWYRSPSEGRAFVRRARTVLMPGFLAGAIVCCVAARPLVTVAFGPEYAAGASWLVPLLIWMVVSIWNNFTGIQTLLAGGYDREYSRCFQAGLALTVGLNLILIWLFQGTGASVAPLLSELGLAFFLHRQIRRLGL